MTSQIETPLLLRPPQDSWAAKWVVKALQAASAGAKDQEAENFLEKKVKGTPNFSQEETIQTAIGALQNVLSEDFKASEIQVGIVSTSTGRKFKELGIAEIEEHLIAISERDWQPLSWVDWAAATAFQLCKLSLQFKCLEGLSG